MTNQLTPQNPSDDIDLGPLFQMVRKGCTTLGILFLRCFLYVKKNALILGGLIVLGVGIGFWLNQTVQHITKVTAIVQPNLDSKNYLYQAVAEIRGHIATKNQSFFTPLGINVDDLQGFSVDIQPREALEPWEEVEDEIAYLELLQHFEDQAWEAEVIRAAILNKNPSDHIITFRYTNREKGYTTAKTLLAYINTNPYFAALIAIQRENALESIEKNSLLMAQIDTLILRDPHILHKKSKSNTVHVIRDTEEVLQLQEGTGIADILELKHTLIRDNAQKKMMLKAQTAPIRIIHFGTPQLESSSPYGKRIIWIPVLLVGLFLVFSVLRYLNRKAEEMEGNSAVKDSN